MKVGVFGGSFDPPHLSHLAVCTFALSLTDLERVLVVPCYEHALAKSLTPFEHRLKMCELTFSELRRAEVSQLERELGGVSYTLRTLEHLKAAEPDWELSLIVGADALRDRTSWHRFDRIEQLAELVVFERRGVLLEHLVAALPAPPELSATEVRGRLGRGESVRGLVATSVVSYINYHGLYRGD